MASRNLIMISGSLLSSPKGMKDACSFRLLNVEKQADKEYKCDINVVAFGRLSSQCVELKQGDRVFVEGTLVTRELDGPRGVEMRKEIIAYKVDLIHRSNGLPGGF